MPVASATVGMASNTSSRSLYRNSAENPCSSIVPNAVHARMASGTSLPACTPRSSRKRRRSRPPSVRAPRSPSRSGTDDHRDGRSADPLRRHAHRREFHRNLHTYIHTRTYIYTRTRTSIHTRRACRSLSFAKSPITPRRTNPSTSTHPHTHIHTQARAHTHLHMHTHAGRVVLSHSPNHRPHQDRLRALEAPEGKLWIALTPGGDRLITLTPGPGGLRLIALIPGVTQTTFGAIKTRHRLNSPQNHPSILHHTHHTHHTTAPRAYTNHTHTYIHTYIDTCTIPHTTHHTQHTTSHTTHHTTHITSHHITTPHRITTPHNYTT